MWSRFREDMHQREPGEWMFVDPADPDRPADLAYRIAKSYYEREADERWRSSTS